MNRPENSGRRRRCRRAAQSPYVSRHGFGYSVFEHHEDGISSELCIYVSIHEPVKFAVFKLKNNSDRRRRLSVTGYWEWVLGELRAKNAMHVVTEIDSANRRIVRAKFL